MDHPKHGGNNIDDPAIITELLTASINSRRKITQSPLPQDVAMANDSTSQTSQLSDSGDDESRAVFSRKSTSHDFSDNRDYDGKKHHHHPGQHHPGIPHDPSHAHHHDPKHLCRKNDYPEHANSSSHTQHHDYDLNMSVREKLNSMQDHQRELDGRKKDMCLRSSSSRRKSSEYNNAESGDGSLNYNSETSLGHQSDHASVAVHAPESIAGDVEDSRSLCSMTHQHVDDRDISSGYHSGGALSDDVSQQSSANNSRFAPIAGGILRGKLEPSLTNQNPLHASCSNPLYDNFSGMHPNSSIRSLGSTGSGSVAGKDTHSNHSNPTFASETARAGGSQSSIGGVSESGSADKFGANHPHSQSSFDGPPGKVMVAHQLHTQHPVSLGGLAPMIGEESRFPTNASYAASEAVKSDIATVCSGSVIEDIDIASVTSVDMGTPHSSTLQQMTPLALYPSYVEKSSGRRSSQGGSNSNSNLKVERGVEFANVPSILSNTMTPTPSSPFHQQASIRTSPVPDVVPNLASSGIVLNDMGPPLSRTLLLERAGTVPTGCASRAGSVRSFGSQAPSDVVAHVDTDDCGGSLMENESRASIHSQEDIRSIHSQEGCESDITTKQATCTMTHNYNNVEAEISNDAVQSLSNNPLHNSQPGNLTNGRTSPGGTVYKGRGVRRYQGRYMHLPLKRFHQDGAIIPPPVDDSSAFRVTDNYRSSPEPDHRPPHAKSSFSRYQVDNRNSTSPKFHKRRSHSSRSWSRSRSRSRSRDRKNSSSNRNRSWSRSPSPRLSRNQTHSAIHDTRPTREPRSNNYRKPHASNNSGGRWRNNQRGGKNNRRENPYPSRHRNGGNRRGGEGSNYYHRGGNGGGFHCNAKKRSESPPNDSMPPRDPKHFRDTRRKKSTSRSKSK